MALLLSLVMHSFIKFYTLVDTPHLQQDSNKQKYLTVTSFMPVKTLCTSSTIKTSFGCASFCFDVLSSSRSRASASSSTEPRAGEGARRFPWHDMRGEWDVGCPNFGLLFIISVVLFWVKFLVNVIWYKSLIHPK